METIYLGIAVFLAIGLVFLYKELNEKYNNRNAYNDMSHWHLYYYDSKISPRKSKKHLLKTFINRFLHES